MMQSNVNSPPVQNFAWIVSISALVSLNLSPVKNNVLFIYFPWALNLLFFPSVCCVFYAALLTQDIPKNYFRVLFPRFACFREILKYTCIVWRNAFLTHTVLMLYLTYNTRLSTGKETRYALVKRARNFFAPSHDS
jgi:hypothetical protein